MKMSICHFRLWSCLVLSLILWSNTITSDAAIGSGYLRKIREVNKLGPYLGIVVPNMFEMDPLLHSDRFVPDSRTTSLDIMGRRFRVGKLEHQKVIIVMTGLSMLNAGITTELLLALFEVDGVVHYGIAGNANPELQIGDVTIPRYWAHSGLWSWQRYGSGPNDTLAQEPDDDSFTREIGYLRFANYSTKSSSSSESDNFLNSVWYQREEIFPVDGSPEVRQRIFKVPVDSRYMEVAESIERDGVALARCVSWTACLPKAPILATVEMGVSGSVFVDNKAYGEFLNSEFNATAVDMESAAVALVCYQQKVPFIAIRALSDLAGAGEGGSSARSDEADALVHLAAANAVRVLIKFIAALASW